MLSRNLKRVNEPVVAFPSKVSRAFQKQESDIEQRELPASRSKIKIPGRSINFFLIYWALFEETFYLAVKVRNLNFKSNSIPLKGYKEFK